jgi:hypothetical protein
MLTLSVVGQSRPFVEVQPASGIDFSNRVPTFSVPRIATLIYNGSGKIEYAKPQSSSPKFEAELRETRQPSIAIITVKANPPFDKGENKATITLQTNQPEQPTVQVPVKLQMPARIEVTPPNIAISNTSATQQVMVALNNSGSTSLSILEIIKSHPEIQTQFYPEPDGKSYRLQVTLPAGLSLGAEGGKVTIRTDDKEYGEISIPIRVERVALQRRVIGSGGGAAAPRRPVASAPAGGAPAAH